MIPPTTKPDEHAPVTDDVAEHWYRQASLIDLATCSDIRVANFAHAVMRLVNERRRARVCPKCTARTVRARFQKTESTMFRHLDGNEYLALTCETCGYEATEPCADATAATPRPTT